MTETTVKLLILGLPGIICYFLCHKLIGKPQRPVIEIVLLVFLYSILSYSLVFLSSPLTNYAFNLESDIIIVTFLDLNQKKPIKIDQDQKTPAGSFHKQNNEYEPENSKNLFFIFHAIFCGILLSYFLSYLKYYNVANIIGRTVKATERYGDEDVWEYFQKLPDSQKNNGWLIVRDLKTDLSYICQISTWSDSGLERELILYDASVYNNSTGEHLYDAQNIYLSRNKDDITIEVPIANAIDSTPYLDSDKQKEITNDPS